jgi:hypothetical protein
LMRAQYATNAMVSWMVLITAIRDNCANHLKTIDVSRESCSAGGPLVELVLKPAPNPPPFLPNLLLTLCL